MRPSSARTAAARTVHQTRVQSQTSASHVVGTAGAAYSDTKSRLLLLISLVLIALNLRPALASVSPVLEAIRSDLGLNSTVAGLLVAIPSVCMGVFAFASASIIRRFGLERSVLWSVGLIGVATLSRVAGSQLVILYAGTVAVGAGIAIGQAMLPSVVGRYFPYKTALVTGLYTAAFNAGAVLAGGATVLLRNVTGSWAIALASWGLLAVPAMLAWGVATRGERRPPDTSAAAPEQRAEGLPWRQGRAWFLGFFLGGCSGLYLSVMTWLAPRYQAEGVSADHSGFLFAFFCAVQVAGALIAPALAQRTRDRRPWLGLTLVLTAVGMLAIAIRPLQAPYIQVTLIGLGIGGLFPLVLTLPLDYAPTAADIRRLVAMMLGVGYLLGGLGPLGLGILVDLTGGHRLSFLALASIALLMLLSAVAGLKPARPG